MKLTHIALAACIAIPSISQAQSFQVGNKDAWSFLNSIATAKVGKTLECQGVWEIAYHFNNSRIRCPIPGFSLQYEGNYKRIGEYLHNGWEITDKKILPVFNQGVEAPGFKTILIQLKKVESRKNYEDPILGALRPWVLAPTEN